ncbi:MAG TPA: cob(I)yrinic acid a,c-diamide adenosyltransferase [bacterium]|nr:cob(I)yrinic acid a,c-diamide adenosyltransferase [bacterium]
MPGDEKGYVQVYTGAGKGKTTAALGMCLRAAGHGLTSHIIQFMKGRIDYGELEAVKRFEGLIKLTQGGRECFVSKSCPDPEDKRLAQETLKLAREAMREGKVDILVLDEINVALDFGLIELEDVLGLIREKPERMELVLTGRNAHPKVIEAADLVTEMREVKHYWEKGVTARTGIEC